MPVLTRPKTPWWFRAAGWIAAHFDVEIVVHRNVPDLHWMVQIYKVRREK